MGPHRTTAEAVHGQGKSEVVQLLQGYCLLSMSGGCLSFLRNLDGRIKTLADASRGVRIEAGNKWLPLGQRSSDGLKSPPRLRRCRTRPCHASADRALLFDMQLPESPRLFLVDGYALIYRAFYALISRPLTTSKGENTSAVWGIAGFVQRLLEKHRPEHLVWVHDSGLSFRHEAYPAYKATREKLTEELQADLILDGTICQLLEAYRIPIVTLRGYEADDVIGTLVVKGLEQKMNVVVISGDKDFQQLIRPGVWLLNPGRGGPAGVEEHWVGVENASERLGVEPKHVTDYLALVGDSSDMCRA